MAGPKDFQPFMPPSGNAARLTIKLPSGESVRLTFPAMEAVAGVLMTAPEGTTCEWVIAPPDFFGASTSSSGVEVELTASAGA
ncbi:MAG: hypothetical protein Q8R28_23210 [Dehalococcoidia bacterium]|nr:hypothetical protein [Dehalococcoidia bacterium]